MRHKDDSCGEYRKEEEKSFVSENEESMAVLSATRFHTSEGTMSLCATSVNVTVGAHLQY